jgi:hypothetical protein
MLELYEGKTINFLATQDGRSETVAAKIIRNESILSNHPVYCAPAWRPVRL